jgi:hypothetical protein
MLWRNSAAGEKNRTKKIHGVAVNIMTIFPVSSAFVLGVRLVFFMERSKESAGVVVDDTIDDDDVASLFHFVKCDYRY